ncbi:MAG: threonine--tRNA ligase, partial [Ilumatobacteraceae bacterium]
MADISISLPDGSQRTLPEGSTAATLAAAIGARLARAALAAVVDGEPTDLGVALPAGSSVAIVTADSDEGRHVLRHSTAHVMAQAVTQLFPGAKFTIGPAIADGFYYDFELPGGRTFAEADLEAIEGRMREIVAADQPFVREELPAATALQLFADQPYKCEIIERVSSGAADADDAGELGTGETISVYRNTPEFVDLCRGPHVPSTGRLGHFKLMKVAGAYWRGNEKGPMLQRIYGTAWETKAALDEHLHRLEEAEKRDHRRLAVDLDLLSFPSELGGGLAVWHPKGAIARKLMEDYSRERHLHGGYQFVYTPHLANANLFETSGHLSFYKDGMYPPMEMDNGVYYPKPMNCPMHCLIYASRQRSYRELPLRLFELGTVYRYERAGTLHGLMRIRGFTQDDSHIYCTEDQLQDEIASLLEFVMSVLRAFGFDEFTANLSTKDPKKYVGSDDIWEKSTAALRAALEKFGLPYKIKDGDAAFYGPKIDIDVRDAIGRTWQLSTVQCDFNHPQRFDLEYVGADGGRHRPIMLHRALFGSVERFFGVLLEHYAGAFPTWMAPLQARVLPVAEAHQQYAAEVVSRLRGAGFRVDSVEAADQL